MAVEFSADAEMAALEPWTILIGGRVHTAAPVSRQQVLAFWAVIGRSKDGTATPQDEENALRTLLRAVFPKRWSYWWTGDPVRQIMALDFRARQRAIESFFESLAPAPPPSAPGMNGRNGSPPSSADANGSRPAAPSAVADGASRLA